MPTLAEDRDEIRDLFARFCHFIDTGAVDEWVALYADDGVFMAGSDPIKGYEALTAFAKGIEPGTMHHLVMNLAIDVDGDVASCRSSLVLMINGAVATAGRTADDLVRVDGGWRITRRSF